MQRFSLVDLRFIIVLLFLLLLRLKGLFAILQLFGEPSVLIAENTDGEKPALAVDILQCFVFWRFFKHIFAPNFRPDFILQLL
jgi:hypothetical protein